MSTLSRIFFLLLGAILALLAGLLLPGLNPEQSLMAGLFTLALVYWISEPIPLYVTGILVAFLEALLLGALAEPLGLEARNYRIFLAPFSSPVVVLLFGGFVMARVFSKHNLDLELARVVLGRMGNRPSVLLLAFMLLTAVMSMWMSNTATTAIMVAAILPLVRRMPEGSNLPKAFLLAIPFAANVGGIATPVGTPPNAIALGLLSENGFSLSFFAWMTAAFPLMLLLLILIYFLLRLFFPVGSMELDLGIPEGPRTAHRGLIYTVFLLTVLLWVTDGIHGIPASLIALLPVLLFSASGLLHKKELRDLGWDILFLVGGGIALGTGIRETGLADVLLSSLLPSSIPPMVLALVLTSTIALLATFISNSAAANLMLPLVFTLAGAAPVELMVMVTICASLGMALPVSTPPNAIAFGSDLLRVRDMAKVGVLVTVLSVALTLLAGRILFPLLPFLERGTH